MVRRRRWNWQSKPTSISQYLTGSAGVERVKSISCDTGFGVIQDGGASAGAKKKIYLKIAR